MIKTSEQSKELYCALIKAQSEFKIAIKDAKNDFTKKNYADFQSVVEAARGALSKNELGFTQMPIDTEKGLALVTRIFHSSGQWLEGQMPIRSQKEDPQAIGAAITYVKRYSLQAALGIIASDEDSDAEKAMNRNAENRPASKDAILDLFKKFEGLNVGEKRILTYIGVMNKFELTEEELGYLNSIGADITNKRKTADQAFGSPQSK